MARPSQLTLLAVVLAVISAAAAEAQPTPQTPTYSSRAHWSLQGRLALVTGGSKGLGRAIVEELLEQGCTVLTCARDLSPLEALLAAEPRCSAVAADVSTAEGRATLLKALSNEIITRYTRRSIQKILNSEDAQCKRHAIQKSTAVPFRSGRRGLPQRGKESHFGSLGAAFGKLRLRLVGPLPSAELLSTCAVLFGSSLRQFSSAFLSGISLRHLFSAGASGAL